MNSVVSKRKRSAYDASFKLKVIEYAEANNNCAAAHEFVVNEKQEREWETNKATLEKMPMTKGGNLMRPDIDLVAKWVKEAWDSIPSEMIAKSFRKCCISNAMDGTEDDEIFHSDNDEESEENDTLSDDHDDNDDVYDESMPVTEAEFRELFGESDTEPDFEGF